MIIQSPIINENNFDFKFKIYNISIFTDIVYIDMKKTPCVNINGIIPFLKAISGENRLKILCFLKS
jgi:hypothetical protein